MTFHRDSTKARNSGVTYHLLPQSVWNVKRDDKEYVPEAFAHDGFIHCTNGLDQLVAAGNRYYKDDSRSFLVLALDVTRITSDVRYDDRDKLFPHIYGPLNTDAVIGEQQVRRAEDGTFLSVSD